jgi:rhodanese-related sulfurtransferase
MGKIITPMLFVIIFSLFSCSASSVEISPEKAYKMINDDGNYTIIDIRKPSSYKDGHIKNAISIEFHPNTFVKDISKIDRKNSIIIYCNSGKITGKAKPIINDLKFKNFHIIAGGLKAWKAKSLPIVKTGNK